MARSSWQGSPARPGSRVCTAELAGHPVSLGSGRELVPCGGTRGRGDALLLHVLQRLEYATAEDRPGVTGQLRADAAREREDCGALESRAQVLEELRNDRSVLLGVMPHDRGELLE